MQKNISLYVNNNNCELLLLDNIFKTTYFHERLIGLMMKKQILPNGGLIINDCSSIHTCFMRMTIDAYFFNSDGIIIKIYKRLRPWRFTKPIFSNVHVLETEVGKIKYPLKVNQKLEFRCIS